MGSPEIRFLPVMSIVTFGFRRMAPPSVILTCSAVRSPISMLYFFRRKRIIESSNWSPPTGTELITATIPLLSTARSVPPALRSATMHPYDPRKFSCAPRAAAIVRSRICVRRSPASNIDVISAFFSSSLTPLGTARIARGRAKNFLPITLET